MDPLGLNPLRGGSWAVELVHACSLFDDFLYFGGELRAFKLLVVAHAFDVTYVSGRSVGPSIRRSVRDCKGVFPRTRQRQSHRRHGRRNVERQRRTWKRSGATFFGRDDDWNGERCRCRVRGG